jgi:sigma-B regulation protein RsbU (phosphoserine phosphatase)
MPMPSGDHRPVSAALAEVIDLVESGRTDMTALLGRLRDVEASLRRREQDEKDRAAALEHRELDARLARRVYQASLPDAVPVIPGFRIGGATFPTQETGGDFLDFLVLPDYSLLIAIGDATGHGIGAALLIVQLCAYLRALALTERSVGQIIALANRRMAADFPEGCYATLMLAQFNPAYGSLVTCGAGHLPAYLLDDRGEVRKRMESFGTMLGIEAQGDFPLGPLVTLKPGELALFLTDGIVEAPAPDGTQFGMSRVLAAIREHRHDDPDAIVKALVAEVRAFVQGTPPDDMTAIVLQAVDGAAR